jgi:hypothetical protein
VSAEAKVAELLKVVRDYNTSRFTGIIEIKFNEGAIASIFASRRVL